MPSRSIAWLRRLAPVAAALCMAAASTGSAVAHPHVWISARTAVRLGPDNRLVGIEQSWTFDREYSAFATLNLDPGRPDGPGPDKLAELAATQIASLAEYGYFTRAKANGQDVGFGAPQDTRLVLQDGRLTLSFVLPVPELSRLKVMTLALDDESFFIAFNVGREADAVRLAGPGRGCALSVRRPASDAEEGRQIVPDSEALVTDKAAQVVTDYLTRILVACP